MKTYGEIAYTAYREHTGHKSIIAGLDIAPWGSLSDVVKAGWEVAADAVVDAVREADTDPGATPTHG